MTITSGDGLPESQVQYLQEYRKLLDKQLEDLTSKALDEWIKNSDAAFKSVLKEAAELALSELTKEIGLTAAGAAASTGSSADFTKAVTNLVTTQVGELLFPDKTSVNSSETERSTAQRNELKLSRSQQQAALARQTSQGQRNL